jgi:hypothetical protein
MSETIKNRTVKTILSDHKKWNDGKGGRRLVWSELTDKERSNLSGSDLSGSDLRGSDLSGSDLSGSDLRGSALSWSALSWSNLSRSNLSGSDLRGSDLRGSDLSGSDLSGSDLSGSDLSGSDISGSDLSGSDLSGSNLSGSDLSNGLAIVQGPARSDGYHFSLRACCIGEHTIVAGCRNFTIDQFKAHVAANYPNTPKATETLAIIAFLEVRLEQIFAKWRG